VVRVAAARPRAIHRPGREDAPLVGLVAQRAGDRKAGEVPLLRGIPHVMKHSRRRAQRARKRPGTVSPARPGPRWLVDVLAVLPVYIGEDRGHFLGGDAVEVQV
jgi:hypothetical protein